MPYRRTTARLKKVVLEVAEGLGSDAKAYRESEVLRSTFYRWMYDPAFLAGTPFYRVC